MGSARFAKTSNQIQKMRTNSELEQNQKFPSGLCSFCSLRKNKKPNPKNTNQPRIGTNPRISEWASLASLAPQTQTNQIQKMRRNPNFAQTQKFPSGFHSLRSLRKNNKLNPNDERAQNSNKPKNREPSEFHSLGKDNQKPNTKSNQIKSRISADDEIV